MSRRVILTALLAFLMLMGLLWPLGQVGLSLSIKRGGGVSVVSLQEGMIRAVIVPRSEGKLLERDEYRIGWGKRLAPIDPPWLYRFGQVGGNPELGVSLLGPVIGALLLLGIVMSLSRRRRRRLLKQHLCLGCGFQRSSSDGPCSECGCLQADLARRSAFGFVVRDASLSSLIVLGCLTWFAAYVNHTDQRLAAQFQSRVFDYSWYLKSCTPRLSGEVWFAEPGTGVNSLASTLQRATPGSIIVLGPGDHAVYDSRQRRSEIKSLRDVWLVGSGRDTCTLSIELEVAERVRIEGLTINCNDSEFLDCRDAMAVTLRDCKVINYNSGAGGSNAIFGVGSVLLVEDCEFDGRGGHSSASRSRGDAFDLRGLNSVYVRTTVFANNDEIGRHQEMVLDRCRHYSDQRAWPPASGVLTREFDAPRLEASFQGREFTQAIDDLDVLATYARTRSIDAWTDPLARKLIDQASIDTDPAFWRRLLLHPKAEVRALAQQQLRLPEPVPPTGAIEDWLEQLSLVPLPREVVEAMLSDPGKSRPLLEAKAKFGTVNGAGNAKALLRLMEVQPPIADILKAQDLDKR